LAETVTPPTPARQLPVGDEIFLDHVGHFVRSPEAAARALVRAGFAPAPVSVQANPDGTPTGTGNVTAMLAGGYLEVLFKTADTPIGLEFEAALAGHAGLHLVAFSVADAGAAHARLSAAGFPMRPLVQFQRPVETVDGPDIAAFTVVRVDRGAMAEGRVQILTHKTEHTVWQPRWLTHPNGAVELLGVVVAVADVREAAERFARFTARDALPTARGERLRLDRGTVELMRPEAFLALFPELAIPGLPFIGAYGVRVKSLSAAEAILRDGGVPVRAAGGALIVPFPAELGLGAWAFVEDAAGLPWSG
jgi:hypothetical protein